MKNKVLNLRNRIRRRRLKLNNKKRCRSYIELSVGEHGVTDMKELLLDKEFLKECIKEIEKSRERMLVYDKKYQRFELDEWIKKRDRKLLQRRILEKVKDKESKEQQ